MADWADDFFVEWQRAWGTGTEAVLEFVTDDIEYWDVTLPEPIRGREAYAGHCDNFFTAFTECEWSLREPVICEGDRVTEPWAFTGLNSGPIWIGLPATGLRRVTQPSIDLPFSVRCTREALRAAYMRQSALRSIFSAAFLRLLCPVRAVGCVAKISS
mgnify:CR=1 FL=1